MGTPAYCSAALIAAIKVASRSQEQLATEVRLWGPTLSNYLNGRPVRAQHVAAVRDLAAIVGVASDLAFAPAFVKPPREPRRRKPAVRRLRVARAGGSGASPSRTSVTVALDPDLYDSVLDSAAARHLNVPEAVTKALEGFVLATRRKLQAAA